ncbi:alpha/beta hydrolase fold domain-containing protein [Actinomadura sp. 9N407]|uniref:alpha/beta hydrolase fold domain-containing protein n=1 Tax=Actinomadura sp. 9N407 TaxID=3375154 RepID=UPI0037A0F87B
MRTALVNGALRLVKAMRPSMDTSQEVGAFVRRRTAKPAVPTPPSGRGMRGVRVTVERRHGIDVYRVRPEGPPATGTPACTAVYFHGGAYVLEIERRTWLAVARMVRRTGAHFLVPIYTVAPHATASTTVAQAAAIVADAIDEAGPERVVVMGDSAGGGLALAAALELRERGAKQPSRLVLVSPWLDATMTHPDQPGIQRRDLVLTVEGLAACGRLYAGDLDVRDRRVSPLLADLTGLPPMTVMCGTHDILVVDSRRLRDRAGAAGLDIVYTEEPGMQHVYFAVPLLPQSKRARRIVRQALTPTASSVTGAGARDQERA